MAITFNGQKLLTTPSNVNVLANQSSASVSLKFRFEPGGNPAQSAISFLVSRNYYGSGWISLVGAGTTPGTVKLQFAWRNASTQATRNVELSVGVVYHLAMTYDQGSQVSWVNGQPQAFGTLSGATAASNSPLRIGGWESSPGAGSLWTIDDVAIWGGYVLTAADVANLRNGVQAPSEIGGAASWRGEWTLAGPTGAVPAVGDAGLANALGDATYNLTGSTGTGSIAYADPLVWTPSSRIRSAYVGTSGKTLFIFFERKGDGTPEAPTKITAAPTVRINGVDAGSLGNPLATGKFQYAFFTLPPGAVARTGDEVTISAPVEWANTAAGAAEAVTDYPLAVHTGESCFGTESLEKTLRLGINIEFFPTGHNNLSPYIKNMAKQLGRGSGVATRDAKGKPLTLTTTAASFLLHQMLNESGIDGTGHPGWTGLMAIGWDDLDGLTSWSIASNNPANTTVTERTDLANPGVGGVGKVRVFNVQRAAGSTTAVTELKAVLSHAGGTPQFDNLVIHGPGDFSYADNTPTVLDRSDPYALSKGFLDRVKNAGSIRAWPHLIGGKTSSLSEPEHMFAMDEFSWGWGNYKTYGTIRHTSVSPFSTADTPYYYWPNAGEKYAATLSSPIDASTTTLTISDAATAPVLAGLRLFVDDEVMRVTAVSGTTVTVVRGAQNTTPASHAAGPIQVGYRLTMFEMGQGLFGSGTVQKFTTQDPHNLQTGYYVTFDGSWPTLTYTDGKTGKPTGYGGPAMVTGANTFVVFLGPYSGSCSTLTGTVALTPASHTTPSYAPFEGMPLIPYGMLARTANQVDCPNVYYAIPYMATDDFIYKAAREIRDNLDPGRKVWIELNCENWNFAAGQYTMRLLSQSLYPGQTYLSYSVRRTDEIVKIFQAVFDEGGRGRSGEIRGYLNHQHVQTAGAAMLNWAAAQDPPIRIHGMAVAPYVATSSVRFIDQPSMDMYANLEVDQCIDLWIHVMRCKVASDPDSMTAYTNAWSAVIDSYNQSTGFDCQLISYEGGIDLIFPPSQANWNQRNRDFFYHPNFYIAEQDWYALCQELGFKSLNMFALACDWYQGKYMWGFYHGVQQVPGRGDGSDGKADNRLCLAEPGKPNSKAATTNQDGTNVSVRGQAWLDWNRAVSPSPSPSPSPKRPRRLLPIPSRYRRR